MARARITHPIMRGARSSTLLCAGDCRFMAYLCCYCEVTARTGHHADFKEIGMFTETILTTAQPTRDILAALTSALGDYIVYEQGEVTFIVAQPVWDSPCTAGTTPHGMRCAMPFRAPTTPTTRPSMGGWG